MKAARFSVTIPPELAQRLDDQAWAQRLNRSQAVAAAVAAWLDQQEKQP